ncbi:MAG TPA: cyclic nucleotide-binding domain-containing protein [Geminicoccaceae bacterium]|nr:cyclic nucleotide-binding domain-containing protein [Geminicoccaceae bacterium]
MRRRFSADEILFRQGDPSAWVVLVHAGMVEVLRETGSDAIVLGTAGAGDFVGEMSVLEARPRSATVRAASDLEAEVIEPETLFERVSQDPALAHRLLLRMSARLRHVEDLLGRLHAAVHAEPVGPATPGRLLSIEVRAKTYAAQFYLGVAPIALAQLPFTVGCEAAPHEVTASVAADLAIAEPAPYRLSPLHFRLLAEAGQVWLRDLDSDLGTIVNRTPLGRDFPCDGLALQPGDNVVVAGGHGSPFEFVVTSS